MFSHSLFCKPSIALIFLFFNVLFLAFRFLPVIFRLHRNLFFCQSLVGPSFYPAVDHGKYWYCTDHTQKTKQRAKKEDGKEDPETLEPDGIPQNLWSQHIPVKLHQYYDQDEKDHPFGRVCDKDQDRTGDDTDILYKKRDYIGHTDDHTDQQCIRNIGNAHDDKGQHPHHK